jgi:hypothetical protein
MFIRAIALLLLAPVALAQEPTPILPDRIDPQLRHNRQRRQITPFSKYRLTAARPVEAASGILLGVFAVTLFAATYGGCGY